MHTRRFAGEGLKKRAKTLVLEIKELSYRERLAVMDLPTLEEKTKGDKIAAFEFLNEFDNVDKGQFFELSRNHTPRGDST